MILAKFSKYQSVKERFSKVNIYYWWKQKIVPLSKNEMNY